MLDVALEHLGPEDTAARACLVAMRAQYMFHQEGDGARARASMTEALKAARAASDPSVLADVVVSAALLGMAHWDVAREASLLEELDACSDPRSGTGTPCRCGWLRDGCVWCTCSTG